MKKNILILNDINKKNNNIDIYKEYTHIRGFHGCRPLSVNDYYNYGIKPIEKLFAKEGAITRLYDEQITPEIVGNLFEKSWVELNSPHISVWLTFLEYELLQNCGHYLIYGSEFICGIATQLSCQSNLKRFGTPTIFHCNIPLENIPLNYIFDINRMVNDEYCEGGFRIKEKVSPSEIIACTHPKKIYDPLTASTYFPE